MAQVTCASSGDAEATVAVRVDRAAEGGAAMTSGVFGLGAATIVAAIPTVVARERFATILVGARRTHVAARIVRASEAFCARNRRARAVFLANADRTAEIRVVQARWRRVDALPMFTLRAARHLAYAGAARFAIFVCRANELGWAVGGRQWAGFRSPTRPAKATLDWRSKCRTVAHVSARLARRLGCRVLASANRRGSSPGFGTPRFTVAPRATSGLTIVLRAASRRLTVGRRHRSRSVRSASRERQTDQAYCANLSHPPPSSGGSTSQNISFFHVRELLSKLHAKEWPGESRSSCTRCRANSRACRWRLGTARRGMKSAWKP
jgi:hypothetical protein